MQALRIALLVVIISPLTDEGFSVAVLMLIGALTAFVVSKRRFASIKIETLLLAAICFGALTASLLAVELFNGGSFESRVTYYFRYTLMLIVFWSFYSSVEFEIGDANKQLFQFSQFLFSVCVAAGLFELALWAAGFESWLSPFKARSNDGGINSFHYARMSGFFSYPGDFAAILVLSIGWLIAYPPRFALYKTLILCGFLLLTQSKAGIIFLLVCIIFWSMRSITALVISVLIIGLISPNVLTILEWLELDYFLRFVDEWEYYSQTSKRASEVWQFLSAPFLEVLFGSSDPQDFYETEIFGALNRVGLIGTLPYLLIFFFVVSLTLQSGEKKLYRLGATLAAFLVAYCTISAGLSRAKIFIVFAASIILWLEAHAQQKRPSKHLFD